MARAWRIEYEGALYHVLSRGNEQRAIVIDNEDRRLFLDTMAQMAQRFELDIFAYVLMDNHYHLLFRTRRANLSKSMQWFGATYTSRFNVKHNRSGHLFQGRFKNMLVENDAYLLQLSHYIHRNPLRAGMVRRLASYEWSSYRAYAYGKHIPKWLNTDMILWHFTNVKNPHRSYREDAQKYAKEEQHMWEDLRHGIFLGTNQFTEDIKRQYLGGRPHQEMPSQKQLDKNADAEALCLHAAEMLSCNLEQLRKSKRICKADKADRDLLIYLLWRSGQLTNQQIGEKFGITYSAVSQRVSIFNEVLRKNRALQKKFDQIRSQIKI
jgi:REP element-mobilizing transposase RayT